MHKAREILVILGMQGYGKSVYAKQHVRTLRRAFIYDPLAEYPAGQDFTGNPEGMIRYAVDHPVFRCKTTDPRDVQYMFAGAFAVRRCSVILEEASTIIPPSMDLLAPENRGAADMVYRGRHPEVSMVCVAQRATTIHVGIRSQCNRLITFNQTEGSDVKWLQDATGHNMDAVRTLPPLHYLEVPRGGVPERKRLSVPWARG